MQRRIEPRRARFRAHIAIAASIVAAGWAVAARAEAAAAAPPPRAASAPDFALKGIDGRNLRLSEFRGEPLLLAFWGSWCGPCRESLVVLDTCATETGTPAVGINLDGTVERAAAVAAALRLSYPTLVDERQQVARTYDVARLPLTLLIDRDGNVRARWAGTVVDRGELSRALESLARE